MKRPVTLGLCFVLILVGITVLVSRSSTPAHAQGTCAIPKALGTLRGNMLTALIFEAPNGAISVVDTGLEGGGKCGTVSITIQRR